MEKGKVGFENRGLVILLCVLVMAIVGLGIGIGVVMLNNEEKEAVVVENGLSEVSMAEKVYNEYVEEFDRVREIANGLIEGGMDSATPIVELYSKYIEECFENRELDHASAYIYAENEDLMRAGFKREALDVLLGIDFSAFNEPEQYRWYSKIMSLAGELNMDDVVASYAPLAAEVKAAYDASCAAAEKVAAEGDAVIMRAEGGAE